VELIEALSTRSFNGLIGTSESDWLDFKQAPYQLEDPKRKWELAKPVAAFSATASRRASSEPGPPAYLASATKTMKSGVTWKHGPCAWGGDRCGDYVPLKQFSLISIRRPVNAVPSSLSAEPTSVAAAPRPSSEESPSRAASKSP
jgi:hypothetical protein